MVGHIGFTSTLAKTCRYPIKIDSRGEPGTAGEMRGGTERGERTAQERRGGPYINIGLKAYPLYALSLSHISIFIAFPTTTPTVITTVCITSTLTKNGGKATPLPLLPLLHPKHYSLAQRTLYSSID